jgi:hypothetical protein
MTEHFITLSTTEPNNNVGIVKLRHGDVNSQAIVAQIVENGQLKNFEGLQPFFCLLAQEVTGQGVSEEAVAVFNDKLGAVTYTASDNALQFVGRNEAYFSFRRQVGDQWVEQFSTRSFHYIVEKSIYSQPFKDSNYWWTFKELNRIFNQYIEDGKKSWEEFVEANREILGSIDPGGALLDKVVTFEKIIKREVPNGFNFIIEHDSEWQPEVKVTSYKNAIGIETGGFDTSEVFGGERIYDVPTSTSYDRKKIYIKMPQDYSLDGEIAIHDNVALIINGTSVVSFTITNAHITGGSVQVVKAPQDLIVSLLDETSAQLSWKRGD